MKTKSVLFGMPAICLLIILTACGGDDEETPASQFSFEGETTSLEGSNLYLTNSWANDDRENRGYFISDGVYTNGSDETGWDMGDYEGETYYLGIELSSVVNGELKAGNFPQASDWSLVDDNTTISYIYLEKGTGTDYVRYETMEGVDAPVIVGGGVDDGNSMTIKYSGKLEYYHYDGLNWVEEEVEGSFYFKGEVEDERVM